jgi:hypothetical protein
MLPPAEAGLMELRYEKQSCRRIRVEQVIGCLSGWATVRGSTRKHDKDLGATTARILLCVMLQNFLFHVRKLGRPEASISDAEYGFD